MSKNFQRFIIEFGEPKGKKWSEEWRDDVVRTLADFNKRLYKLVSDEGLGDQINLRGSIHIGGTPYMTLACTREMSERIRKLKGVVGVFVDGPVEPYADKDNDGGGFGPFGPPKADSRRPVVGGPRQSFMVQVKTDDLDIKNPDYTKQVSARLARLRKRIGEFVEEQGLAGEIDLDNANEIDMAGVLVVNCTPRVAEAIRNMPARKAPQPRDEEAGLPVEMARYTISIERDNIRDWQATRRQAEKMHGKIGALIKQRGLEGEARLAPVGNLANLGGLSIQCSPSVAALIRQMDGIKAMERAPDMDGPDATYPASLPTGPLKRYEFTLQMVNRMAPESHVFHFMEGTRRFVREQKLGDQIDLNSIRQRPGLGVVEITCSPRVAHLLQTALETKASASEMTSDTRPHIITLKQPRAGDSNAMRRHTAIFHRALGNLLKDKGLTDEATLDELGSLAEMGILTIDCSDKVADLIGRMAKVEEIRPEEIYTTQKKDGADRGYKPTPPTWFPGAKGPDKNCWDPRQHGNGNGDKPADPMVEMRDWQVQIKLPNGERSNEASRVAFAAFKKELGEMLQREGLKDEVDISGVGNRYALGSFEIRATFNALRKIEEMETVEWAGDIPDFLDRRRPVSRKDALPTL